jgi:hypothetical protein
MALKKIIKTGVETGQTIEALQVSQSYDAFNPSSTVGYEIGISGSLEVSGSSTFHLATAADKFKIENVQANPSASNALQVLVADTGSGVLYYDTSIGAQGTQGIQGTQGVQGTQGIQGIQGSTGA